MLFKSKGSQCSNKDVNKPTNNKSNFIESSSTSRSNRTVSGGLRVTGATVSGVSDEVASLAVGNSVTVSHDLEGANKEAEETFHVDNLETDNKGFVVKRLIQPEIRSTQNQQPSAQLDSERLSNRPSSQQKPVPYFSSLINPPPSAPRSTPIGCLNEEADHTIKSNETNRRQNYHSYSVMASATREGRDLSLPRLPNVNRPGGSGVYDVHLRATTSPGQQRFPGLSQGTQAQLAPRPESEMSNAGLPPFYVRTTTEEVERLPAIHPSVWASRGEKRVEYRGFVSAPPMSASPPCTAAARRSTSKLNAIPLKRPSAVKKIDDTPTECWRCALRLEHSKCETAKYIRIGGGFRHSYWFVRQLIEKAKEEEDKQMSLIRREQQAIFSEKLAWRVGKDGKKERRIKTFVRTSSGRKIAKYQYVPEDVYDEMMELNQAGSRATESAKRRLKQKLAQSMGLSEEEADLLDTWDVQSVGAADIAMDEEGNPLLDEDGEPILIDDVENIERAVRRNRRKKEGGDHWDEESERADSGLAFSDTEEKERRGRYRRGGRDSDGRDSEGSIFSQGGRRRMGKTKGSVGGDSDFSDNQFGGGPKQRRQKGRAGSEGSDIESAYGSHTGNRRKKGGKGKGDSGSDFSDDGGTTGKKKGGRRGRNKSRDGSGDSFDSRDPKSKGKRGKGKKKGAGGYDDDESEHSGSRRRGKGRRKGKKGGGGESGSESGDSVGSRRRTKKGKGKKKGGHGTDDDSDSGSARGEGRRKKKKGKKGHTDSGSDHSDTDDPGRKHKSRRHKKKGGADDDDSEGSYTDGGRGGRRKKDKRRGKHRSGSEDYSDEDGEGGGRGKDRRRRHRNRRDRSGSGDDGDYSSDEGRRKGGRNRRGKGGRRRRDDDGSDYSDRSGDDSRDRRHRRRKDRHRRHRDDSRSGSDRSYSDDSRGSRHRSRRRRRHRRDRDRGSDGDSYSSGSDGADGGHRRRRHRKHGRRKGRRGSSYSDDHSGSESGDDDGRRKRRSKKERRRRHRRKDGDDYSDGSGYSDESMDSQMSGDSRDRRRRRRKKDKHRRRRRRHSSDDYDDDYSDDSRSRRRRRRHRRRSYSNSDGSESYDSGADAESRRGRKKRHRRRRRSYSHSDYSDESSRSRSHRRRHGRHRRRRRSGSEYSDDSGSSRSRSRHRRRGGRKKGRHRRHSSYGSDSGSGSSRSRSRHRHHRRRRHRRDSSSDDYSDDSRDRRHRRRRRHRRHRSDSSSSDYTTSTDDSRPRRRHKGRHRRYSDSDDDSDSSYDRDRRRGKRKDKKHHRRRRYSTSTEESSAGDEKSSRRKKDKHRRRRDRYYSSDSDDSSYDSRDRRRRDKKKKRPPRPPSSDSSSLSSEEPEERLAKMSKKERRAYEKRRQEKMERKERRAEQREEYERYVAKKEKKKERRKNREDRGSFSSSDDDDSYFGDGKTAVKYDRGSRRKILDKSRKDDDRDIGYDDPNDPWRKKERRRGDKKKKDRARGGGDDSPSSDDMSSEFDPSDPFREKKKGKTKKKKGKGGAASSSDESEESIYEDVFEDDGTVHRRKVKVPKKKKGKDARIYDDDELDAESEYDSIGSADADKLIARQIYDKDGEVIRLTKDGRRIKDGKISKEIFDVEKHQQKKKKKKKEKEMMEKSYEEEYIEEFIDEEGNVVKVVKKRLKEKTTAPGKRPTTPLVGSRRVQVLFLRGGKAMQERLDRLLKECPLSDDDPRTLLKDSGATDIDERGSIDYLTHYRLVNPSCLEAYGKAFLVEDTDENYAINISETRVALEGIPALQGLNDKQVNYILKVLGIDDTSIVTFKMFAVIAALCERLLSVMDDQTRQWMEINDLADMERKIGLYRAMFYWNTCSDRSSNYIKTTSLRIELIAGGLSRVQEEYVIEKIEPNTYREVSFIDYMAFIPLFLSTHESIIHNPLDMSRDKFNNTKALEPQRDMVPLGRPMTQVGASTMESCPIPYEFEKRPGSSLRKRIRLVTPKPKVPTPDLNDDDSLNASLNSFSPVPPKMSRMNALRRGSIMAGTR